MAFSFGAATPAPAFGATPAFSFGAPAAASSTPAAAAPSLFGSTPAPAVSTTAFGASTSLFGAAPASSPSLFGAAPASSPSLFGTTTTQPVGSPFGAAFGSLQTQQQQQQLQAGLITYSTRYDDLPADRQKELQDIQREIGSYREDCEKLDRDKRLHDSDLMKKSLEEETSVLKQSLQGMLNSLRADDDALADFREKVLKLLRSTEHAVRTYQRSKLWRDAPQQYKGQTMPPQVQELLASPVLLPSPYLEQAIQGFQQTLENYGQVLSELEQALPSSDQVMASMTGGAIDTASVVQSLPLVISHMHDYFVHVAARLEKLHLEVGVEARAGCMSTRSSYHPIKRMTVQRCKEACMVQRRTQGEFSDPFAESRRLNTMACTPQRAGGKDGHVVVSTPPQHYGTVHGTPGASPFQPTPTVTAASPILPFGTPFGGALSPSGGDMSRGSSRRRR